MDRRKFISGSAFAAAGWMTAGRISLFAGASPEPDLARHGSELYDLFRNPASGYRPFVRWWWNGNKVEEAELIREMRLLKEAGIDGVEINPVKFPSRSEGDDMGKRSLQWLSDEWLSMLQAVFNEAKSLGMACDLIVGSGWPFGAEYLQEDERSSIVVIAVKKLTGPLDYSISKDEIFVEADPEVSSPWDGRKYDLLSLSLVPVPLMSTDQIIDLSYRINSDYIDLFIPEGSHALYALVRITGFMEVINGSPGASGPVLDHFNEAAVSRYLNRMSEAVVAKTGDMSQNLRAMFTDSMELEGANWSDDMRVEFISRRGYDIFPFLPYVLFRTGAMGNITDRNYGAETGPIFEDMIRRMRYDFEITKAELLEERFLRTFASWCSRQGVKSRMQAYGRGFFPLESSMPVDIPEGESWTMNWLKHRIGEEMPENDYRRGRAYTMINKYVSSAAHLSGKKLVSCEEMTDTYTVFNTSLENLKIGSDQSIISGVTHSVFHGFNYSPPEAPYPGWIRYGGYFNEKNNWWPYVQVLNGYKGRLSAVLQNTEMFADIAVLPPTGDMWSTIGAQNEPFPSMLRAEYLSLIWEAIVKNGSGCDYVSERIIRNAEIENGCLRYGDRKYNTIFLIEVESLEPLTAAKLLGFIQNGGRIFCIETIPSKSLGYRNHKENDLEVAAAIERMITYSNHFIVLKKPEKDYIGWYKAVLEQHHIIPYIHFEKPGPFLMQTRYQAADRSEFIFIINSHINDSQQTRVIFSNELTRNRHGWVWDPETGSRYRITLANDNGIDLDLGPAESILFVFSHDKSGPAWKPLPVIGDSIQELRGGWRAEFIHCHDGTDSEVQIGELRDLKDMPDMVYFSGTVIYRNSLVCEEPDGMMINLGKVYGTSELKINGISCGVKWYGRRIYSAGAYLHRGLNEIEITVTTSMGNYMKSLTDNPIAQYWTNSGNKNQPLQSMGMTGPVKFYKS